MFAGQVSDQVRGIPSARTGPRATLTLGPSVWGQAPNSLYFPASHEHEGTAPASGIGIGSYALAGFNNAAPTSNTFAQGLPSPSSMPFTMGSVRQGPNGASRLRRARQMAAASGNPPRFRNRMQQRRAQTGLLLE